MNYGCIVATTKPPSLASSLRMKKYRLRSDIMSSFSFNCHNKWSRSTERCSKILYMYIATITRLCSLSWVQKRSRNNGRENKTKMTNRMIQNWPIKCLKRWPGLFRSASLQSIIVSNVGILARGNQIPRRQVNETEELIVFFCYKMLVVNGRERRTISRQWVVTIMKMKTFVKITSTSSGSRTLTQSHRLLPFWR